MAEQKKETVEGTQSAVEPTRTSAPVAVKPVQAPMPVQAPVTLESASADLGVPLQAPRPVVTPKQVFSAQNIQQATTAPAPKPDFAKMSADDLAKQIAESRNEAELRQIGIGNQAIRQSAITGQQAHQSRLDTASLNALSGLLGAKEAELARERQAELDKQNEEMFALDLEGKRLANAKAARGPAGIGIAKGANQELAALANSFERNGGDWGATANDLASQGFDVSSGSVIDNELRRRNGLEPIVQQSAADLKFQQSEQASDAERVSAAQAAIPGIEKNLATLDAITGRGVGAGLTGSIERNIPSLFGAKPDNIARIKSVIGQETLNALLNLKAQGGTLGAISEKELDILASSANIIGAAVKTNKSGNVVGYNLTENAFKKEIDRMKESAQRVLEEARRTAGMGGAGGGSYGLSDEEAYQQYLNILGQ